jgi:long-chain fatty acid transport protein
MMRRNVLTYTIASAMTLVGTALEAQAAAFALYEHGASGLGVAYAGAAAVAEDASTVWWNPAGMARLRAGKHAALAGGLIVPSTKFSNGASIPAAASNPALNGNGGDAGDKALVPSFFFAMDLDPTWNFGFGASVPFGLATKYDPSWLGRFQGVESEVKTLNLNPAVSYRISDAASIGAGINYQQGKIDLMSAVNYSGIAFGAGGAALLGAVGGAGVEGQNKSSIDGDAWGFNVGGLFNLAPATRVGVHYRSSLKYSLKGNTRFSGRPAALAAALPDSDVKLDLKTPDNLSLSGVHKLNDWWDLLADVTWTHWSRIKQLPLVRTSGTANGATLDTLTFNFKDAWRTSIGVHYRLDNAWTIKAGAAYDQSPAPNAESRSVRLADSDRYWFTFGAKYQVSQNGVLDIGYSYIKARDADINNDQRAAGRGLVNGTYKAHVNVIGIQYEHTF